jgi:ABC-type nitrate/sulfonate/bicarbonate transport system permease component
MKKASLIGIIGLILYQAFLWWTPYSQVLPSIPTLLLDYAQLVLSITWIQALFNSIMHAMSLLIMLALLSFVLVVIGVYIPIVKSVVTQLSEWMATTPTIAILLIGLVLFGLTQSVNIIVSFVIWPLVFERLDYALTSLSDDEQDVMKIFTPTFFEEWVMVRSARIKDELGSMVNMVFPTTLKILIMVEVLHSQTQGYGHLYQMARQSFHIERLITLTIHLIVTLKILKTLTSYYFHKST